MHVHAGAALIQQRFSRQAKLRLEMEMERLRQTHAKEVESKDEEVEEIRQSCSKKVSSPPWAAPAWALNGEGVALAR